MEISFLIAFFFFSFWLVFDAKGYKVQGRFLGIPLYIILLGRSSGLLAGVGSCAGSLVFLITSFPLCMGGL